MKLTDLHPRLADSGGPGVTQKDEHGNDVPAPLREGVVLIFDCPCSCGHPIAVPLDPPMDNGPRIRAGGTEANPIYGWKRTGETFETLTLSPSILRGDGCRWHGWIRDGEVITC